MQHTQAHVSGDSMDSPRVGTPASSAAVGVVPVRMRPRSTAGALVAGGLMMLLIGVLDYWTGPQVSGSLFYLLPVLFVSHFAGRLAGVLAAFGATAVWLTADLNAGAYSHPLIPYWNGLMRLGVFLVVAWLVSAMRILNASLERRVQDRTARLEAEIHERTNLEKRILEITDREQARIGQDLHDGLCQHLVGTAFSACRLQERLAARALPEAADAAQIAAQLDESITQARNLARGLHPVPLEEEGLATALQQLADGVSGRFNVHCALDCKEAEGELAEEVAIHLYRIAQEAVTNAIKHAKPKRIDVRLRIEPNHRFQLRVEDDGSGIEPHPSRSGGMGLSIMGYRARMIGAVFAVRPRAEGGTEVLCQSASPIA
jgi:signal transduction histidine kinase